MKMRRATIEDVKEIVRLLADDALGSQRENHQLPLPETYYDAFRAIAADSNQWLVVAEMDERVVGTLQMTLLPYLTYQGGRRAQIEAVRVNAEFRDQGVGAKMIEWVVKKARAAGGHLVQLTTVKKRPDALKFYERLGFLPTHEGMKLHLKSE